MEKKTWTLPVDDLPTMAQSIKEVFELQSRQITDLQIRLSVIPLVFQAIEGLEKNAEFRASTRNIPFAVVFRVVHEWMIPVAMKYAETSEVPDFSPPKPSIVLAAINGVRVDTDDEGGAA